MHLWIRMIFLSIFLTTPCACSIGNPVANGYTVAAAVLCLILWCVDISMFESVKCPCQFLRYKAYFYCRFFLFLILLFLYYICWLQFSLNNVGWMISLSISTMKHSVLVLEKFLNLPWAVLLPRWGQQGTSRPTSRRMKTTCSANRGWKLAVILL